MGKYLSSCGPPGFVYVMESGGLCKIGYSYDLQVRDEELPTGVGKHEAAVRIEIGLQAFSETHRDIILESMRQRAVLFERVYYESARGYIRVQTPRARAMASVLDDIRAGRL